MKGVLSISAVIVILSFGSAHAGRVTLEDQVNKITANYETTVGLLAGGTYNFWTTGLTPLSSCTADPMMHVYDTATNGALISSSNDNCTSGLTTSPNACVTVTNTSASSQTVRVVIHAAQNCARSSGIFRLTGPGYNYTSPAQEFGGHIIWSVGGNPFVWQSGERIQIVRPVQNLPSGASYRAYLARTPTGLCASNVWNFVGRADTGRAGGVEMPTTHATTADCRTMLVIGTASIVTDRSARVYINDNPFEGSPVNDSDDDTLGDALEQALGTCHNALCPSTDYPNAQDSDHDGLRDDDEVLGSISGERLPSYGANPRHKDAFVEIDYWVTRAAHFTGAVATSASLPFTFGPSAALKNPDGQLGLRLHFDIPFASCDGAGLNCCDVTGLNCSTTFGKWGGS